MNVPFVRHVVLKSLDVLTVMLVRLVGKADITRGSVIGMLTLKF